MKRANDTAFGSGRSAFTSFRQTATGNMRALPAVPGTPIPVMNQTFQPVILSANGPRADSQTAAIQLQQPPVLVARPALKDADKLEIDACRSALQEAVIAGDQAMFNALHLSAQNEHLPVVDCLIRCAHGAALAEAKAKAKAEGGNALHMAAGRGHLNVVQYLLKSKYGAALAKQQIQAGHNALQLTRGKGHHEVVRVMDESGLFGTSSASEEEPRS